MKREEARQIVYEALDAVTGLSEEEIDEDDYLSGMDIGLEEFDEVKEIIEADAGVDLRDLHYKISMRVVSLIYAVQSSGEEDGY